MEQAGADAAEVIDDIRRHVEAEVAASRLRVVTVTELKPMLARIGEPWRENAVAGERAQAGAMLQAIVANGAHDKDEMSGSSGVGTLLQDEPAELERPEPPAERKSNKPNEVKPKTPLFKEPSGFLFAFGVIIPALTLIVEWATGFCARNVFNPIPTWGHIALVALVPVINAFVFIALLREKEPELGQRLGIALGLATGISMVYSVAFIPLVLPGVIALMIGIGLLPLTPYIALASTLKLRGHLRERLEVRAPGMRQRFWTGVLAGILAFLLVDVRYTGTTAAMHMAANPGTEKAGLGLLRAFGEEQTVLRSCYPNRARDFKSALLWILPNGYRVTNDQARRIYFQIYGRPFNSVPAPNARLAGLPAMWEEPYDPEPGGEKVGTPVAGLSMMTSRIDATVEPNAALSYLEWIFEFKNASVSQAEARCEIELPPGAVVSRLTLWINGEEREAAFAGKSQVREAYREVVVVQRRDPVLVTSSGKDRVLMQCFPVTPNGGVMKVRIGMTVPLLLDGEKNGVLRWPYVRERNFALGENLEHSFWIDSSIPVESLGLPLKTERTASGHFMARGSLNEAMDDIVQPTVLIRRSGPDVAWAADTRGTGFIEQTIRQAERPDVKDIVVVLDGSARMAKLARQLAEFQTGGRSVRVIVADGTLREFTWDGSRAARGSIEKIQFAGGQDNIPALERAWDLAAENGAGAVIWVHGPQPVLLSSMEGLKQRFERRPNAVQMFDLPIERGPNSIAAEMPEWARFEAVSMHRPAIEVLEGLIQEIAGDRTRFEVVRERKTEKPAGAESNLHLARLWALDEINRLARAGRIDEAVELAGRYQLVTDVSGAVVLETAEQYARNALQPVAPHSVPVVPEPSTWALMIVGLVGFTLLRRRNLKKGYHG